MKKSRRNIRRKTRKRKYRRRRRRRRGGVKIGKTAKKTMTRKDRSTMGRFGSKKISRKSHLTSRPPKKSPPAPPSDKSKITLREAATISAERKLAKHYGSKRKPITKDDVQISPDASLGAIKGVTGFRRTAYDKRKRDASVEAVKKKLLKTKHDTDSIEKAEPAHKVGVSISKVTTKADRKTPAYWCGDSGLTPALKKKGNCFPSKKKIICKNLQAFCKTKPKSSFCNKCPNTPKLGGRRKYKSRKKRYRRR